MGREWEGEGPFGGASALGWEHRPRRCRPPKRNDPHTDDSSLWSSPSTEPDLPLPAKRELSLLLAMFRFGRVTLRRVCASNCAPEANLCSPFHPLTFPLVPSAPCRRFCLCRSASAFLYARSDRPPPPPNPCPATPVPLATLARFPTPGPNPSSRCARFLLCRPYVSLSRHNLVLRGLCAVDESTEGEGSDLVVRAAGHAH
jgi:hypothetical protein